MIDGIIPSEIREGPAAILSTLANARSAAAQAAAGLHERDVRRLFVIGNGTSYHSSLAAAALYRRHASPSDPTVVPLTAADFRTYRPALDQRDAVIGVSSSGEFRDVVAVVEE